MWILGTIAVSRNVLRRDTPVPSRIATPNRSSPRPSAPAALSTAHLLWTSQPPKANLWSSSKCLPQILHGARTCCSGIVPRHSPWWSSSSRSVRFRDKSTISGVMCALLRRRCSAAVTLALISCSFVVFTDLPRARICWRRGCSPLLLALLSRQLASLAARPSTPPP